MRNYMGEDDEWEAPPTKPPERTNTWWPAVLALFVLFLLVLA
jgi:hypothetical protein